MPFIDTKEFAKYEEAIVVNVFTDRISAYAIKKDASGISLLASATEYQENGEMNEEKIKLNCEKALQALPREYIKSDMPIVFMLGPEISECAFVSVEAKRDGIVYGAGQKIKHYFHRRHRIWYTGTGNGKNICRGRRRSKTYYARIPRQYLA